MPNRIAQIYGYTVCLVAVIVTLMSLNALLNAVVDRSNPLQTQSWGPWSLTSFESYQSTVSRDTAVTEAVQRRRYDALVAERHATVRYQTTKTFLTSGVLLLVAIGLFVTHWRWLRRQGSAATEGR